MTIQNRNDLNQAFRLKANSIVVSDSFVGDSLLIAERVQHKRFPIVVLKRLAAGEKCKVSVGSEIIIPVVREIATETFNILGQLEKLNIELDVEEVATRKNQFILWRLNWVTIKTPLNIKKEGIHSYRNTLNYKHRSTFLS